MWRSSNKLFLSLGVMAVLLSAILSVYLFFPTFLDFSKNSFTISSYYSNVDFDVGDPGPFLEFADSAGIFKKEKVNAIHIVLTKEPQIKDHFNTKDGVTIQSSNSEKKDNVLVIYVYLHPDLIIQQEDGGVI